MTEFEGLEQNDEQLVADYVSGPNTHARCTALVAALRREQDEAIDRERVSFNRMERARDCLKRQKARTSALAEKLAKQLEKVRKTALEIAEIDCLEDHPHGDEPLGEVRVVTREQAQLQELLDRALDVGRQAYPPSHADWTLLRAALRDMALLPSPTPSYPKRGNASVSIQHSSTEAWLRDAGRVKALPGAFPIGAIRELTNGEVGIVEDRQGRRVVRWGTCACCPVERSSQAYLGKKLPWLCENYERPDHDLLIETEEERAR